MIKLANLLRKGILNESPRLINFIHSGDWNPPVDLNDYTKEHGSNTAVHKVAAQHFKGLNPKDVLVLVAKDPTQAERIKKAMVSKGVIGIWADPITLVLNGKD